MTNDMIAMASIWEERLHPPKWGEVTRKKTQSFGWHLSLTF